MAKFRAHMTFGILWAVIFAAAGYCLKAVNLAGGGVLFFLGLIGACLPDVDSDTAKPTQLLFGVLGAACPALLYPYLPPHLSTEETFCFIVLAYLFFQYGLAWLFATFTKHRGIYHSIPAALIAGALIALIFRNSDLMKRLLYAIAVTGGYLLHLLLDEVSSFDLLGMKMKRSSGTAFCLKSESWISTILAYILLAVLLGLNFC